MAKPRIGYVGVGLMGLPMLKRLVSLGYAVSAYDIVADRMAAARAAGARGAASPAEAAREAELLLLNLPTTAAVEQAVFGQGGAATVLKAPQIVVDFSTVPPAKAKELSGKLRAAGGAGWIDAPVSGGPPASGDGTLTVMAGGEAAEIERALPLLKDVSARCTRLGPVGSGLAAKMINQLVVGIGHAMLAEAIVLAEGAGLDAAQLPQALAGGLADSNLMQRFYPRMLKREFAPQGYVRQLLKDLEMVHEFAAATKSPTPMTAQALSLYRMLAHLGHTELDTTALIKLYDAR
ncbi:MAG TPA: NAD(P)-dependent oxidoreductase [Burkholderiales bacterium]|nr:NAD(P)-dependent oxidoreductase [Burkholderiales bacterium]